MWVRKQGDLPALFNLEKAVEPRMNTDLHRGQWFTSIRNYPARSAKSLSATTLAFLPVVHLERETNQTRLT